MHTNRVAFCLLLQTALVLPCVAQPTIIAGQMARQVGDVYTFRTCGPMAFPGTGEGITWDFAAVSGPGCGSSTALEPTGTVGEVYFPTATVAVQEMDGMDAAYYISSPTEEIWLGHFATKFQSSFCTDPRTEMVYPFTYGTAFTDSMVCAETDGYFRTRYSEAVTTGEGYGTVVLPYGTFTDCLLVHRHAHYSDVYDQDPAAFVEADLYTFVKPGIAVPLFSIEQYTTYLEDGSSSTVQGSMLLDQLSTGVLAMQQDAGGMVLSPNPAHDRVELQRTTTGPAHVNLLTVDGRILSTAMLSAGTTTHGFPLVELPSGVYAVQLIADGTCITQRVMKD